MTFSAALGLDAVLDLLLPRRCAGCSRPGTPWCPDCASCFAAPFPVHRPGLPPGLPVFAVGAYRGAARKAVLAAKERGRRDLLAVLAVALAAALHRLFPGPLWLVPAPSRAAASRRRGGPHMTAIAERVARLHPARVAHPLRLTRGARDSVGLSAADRAENLRGHLTVLPGALPPPRAPVVLLDDVITTGATAAACTRALRGAGTRVHAVLACTAVG